MLWLLVPLYAEGPCIRIHQSARKLQSQGPDGTIRRDFLRNKNCKGLVYPAVHVGSLGLDTWKAPSSVRVDPDEELKFCHSLTTQPVTGPQVTVMVEDDMCYGAIERHCSLCYVIPLLYRGFIFLKHLQVHGFYIHRQCDCVPSGRSAMRKIGSLEGLPVGLIGVGDEKLSP